MSTGETRAFVSSPRPLERLAAPPRERFGRDYVKRSRAAVLEGMIDGWPALGRWSPDYLRQRYAEARVSVARMQGERVAVDARVGLVHDEMRLGEFLGALQAGTPRGYLSSRLETMPPELQAEVLLPVYCEGA